MKQFFKDLVHNVIVHPLMVVLPSKQATILHDRNADWAFGKDTRLDEIGIEKGNVVFIVSANRGYDDNLRTLHIWTSLQDAIDNCKENNEDGRWSYDFYLITEFSLNSTKHKDIYSKSFNWGTDKWDEDFLKERQGK